MSRARKAWLFGGDGVRIERGSRRPGWYVCYNEYVGERKIQRRRCFPDPKTARKFVKDFNAKAQLLLLGACPAVPIDQAANEFFSGIGALARDTRIHYATALGFLVSVCGAKTIGEYGGSDIDRLVAARLAVSSEATVAKHVRGLRRFFSWAKRRGYVAISPVEQATSPPKGAYVRERPIITDDMLRTILEHVDTEDRRLAVLIAATTGIDRKMIGRITSHHLDAQSGILRLVRPKRRSTGHIIAVPLHADLLTALSRRSSQTSPATPLLRGLHRNGKDWWSTAAKAAGCPHVLFRDLRAYAVQRGIRAGVPLSHLSRMLGHATVTTTTRHYTLPDPSAAEKLSRHPLPGAPDIAQEKP